MSLEKSDLILQLKLYKSDDLQERYLKDALVAVLSGTGYMLETSAEYMSGDYIRYAFRIDLARTHYGPKY